MNSAKDANIVPVTDTASPDLGAFATMIAFLNRAAGDTRLFQGLATTGAGSCMIAAVGALMMVIFYAQARIKTITSTSTNEDTNKAVYSLSAARHASRICLAFAIIALIGFGLTQLLIPAVAAATCVSILNDVPDTPAPKYPDTHPILYATLAYTVVMTGALLFYLGGPLKHRFRDLPVDA